MSPPASASAGDAGLPFIDAHTRTVGAPTERVWDVLSRQLLPRLGGPAGPPLARLLGSADVERPRAGGEMPDALVGFHVAEATRPSLIALEGSHRFSRYALTFRIEPSGPGTCIVTAETRAVFPGLAGGVYRAAVIGSGAHVIVVRRLLSHIARLAERG